MCHCFDPRHTLTHNTHQCLFVSFEIVFDRVCLQAQWLDDQAMCEHLDADSAFLAQQLHEAQAHAMGRQLSQALSTNASVAVEAIRTQLAAVDYEQLQALNQTIHQLLHK